MFGLHFSRLGSVSRLGLVPKALAILRKYGTDAHVYLPGIGTVSGLTAGNYLNSAGTTAATVDNPVGLSLDALQAMTLGAELVVGASNLGNNGWTPSGSGGVKIASGAIGSLYGPYGSIGPTYLMVVVVSAISGTITPQLGSSPQSVITSPGTYQYVVKPSAGAYFYLDAPAATTATVTSVSVREIPGIHATQATTANKPILRRGLLNKLLWSNDLTNAAWTKNNATFSGVKVTPAAASGNYKGVQQNSTLLAAYTPTTVAAIVEAAGYSFASLVITGNNGRVGFDVANILSVNYAGIGTSTAVSLGNGRVLIAYSLTTNVSASNAWLTCTPTQADPAFTYTCDGTSGINVYAVGAFPGLLTAQQILDAGGIPLTTSAAASSATGKYWWQFDGVNDSLSLSAPLFQMSDDHCVIAGANCTKTASWNTVFGQGGATATQRIQLGFDASTGYALYYLRDDAATSAQMIGGVDLRNQNVVLTAKKTGSTKILRVNSAQVATNATVLGTTTFTGGSIGSGGSVSGDYFQGSIYPLIGIKGTLSDPDLLVLERFVGQLSGVSL